MFVRCCGGTCTEFVSSTWAGVQASLQNYKPSAFTAATLAARPTRHINGLSAHIVSLPHNKDGKAHSPTQLITSGSYILSGCICRT